MKIRTPIAIFFIATNLITTGVWGQNVYKCGNTYSQQPCPGGTLVDASDARTSEQKKASDVASQRNAKAADALEQARLKKEKTEHQALTGSKKAGQGSIGRRTYARRQRATKNGCQKIESQGRGRLQGASAV